MPYRAIDTNLILSHDIIEPEAVDCRFLGILNLIVDIMTPVDESVNRGKESDHQPRKVPRQWNQLRMIPWSSSPLNAGSKKLGNRASILKQVAYVKAVSQPQTFPQAILLLFNRHGNAFLPVKFLSFLDKRIQALG